MATSFAGSVACSPPCRSEPSSPSSQPHGALAALSLPSSPRKAPKEANVSGLKRRSQSPPASKMLTQAVGDLAVVAVRRDLGRRAAGVVDDAVAAGEVAAVPGEGAVALGLLEGRRAVGRAVKGLRRDRPVDVLLPVPVGPARRHVGVE